MANFPARFFSIVVCSDSKLKEDSKLGQKIYKTEYVLIIVFLRIFGK